MLGAHDAHAHRQPVDQADRQREDRPPRDRRRRGDQAARERVPTRQLAAPGRPVGRGDQRIDPVAEGRGQHRVDRPREVAGAGRPVLGRRAAATGDRRLEVLLAVVGQLLVGVGGVEGDHRGDRGRTGPGREARYASRSSAISWTSTVTSSRALSSSAGAASTSRTVIPAARRVSTARANRASVAGSPDSQAPGTPRT